MALGSTQPLTEMSTRDLFLGKGRPSHEADNLTAICDTIVYKMWESRRLTILWASTACYRDNCNFNFLLFYFVSFSDVNDRVVRNFGENGCICKTCRSSTVPRIPSS
jgi:hypothetical protein